MADFTNSLWNNNAFINPTLLQSTEFPPWDDFSVTLAGYTTSSSTPSSSDSLSDNLLERAQIQNPKKRRQISESPPSDAALTRERKSRKLRDREGTAKVREIGACLFCKMKKKECLSGDHPDGLCQACLERADTLPIIPGLLRPICWRPNIGSTESFRRGPTIDFAVSLRGNRVDEGSGKQAIWKQFALRRVGKEPSKIVDLSQNWTPNLLRIRLDRYQPMDTDKQHYPWFDEGVEQRYCTPAYGIEKNNLAVASSAIENFLRQNSGGYVEAHMQNATEITRKTFHTAQENKHLPLVERALKLWVGCRFIEEPWSIVGQETLGMSRHPNPKCPYNDRIPVPPIVDLQIDLIVINEILQPELKKILTMLKAMLESRDPWNNWFEIYLAYFILLHNVELTMAHDAWFVKRNNLKKKYSNKNLVDTIMQGATTLLTCFHYAHQGYAPFTNPELEHTQQWSEQQKTYLQDIRPMIQQIRGDHMQDPAKELFWTSQLHRPDWRPVVLIS